MGDACAEKAAEGAGLFADGHPDAAAVAPVVARGAGPNDGYLGHRARLRRRLLDGGPAALLDHELLEIVLFLALPRRDTKPIAQALMRRFGGFAGTVGAPARELDAVEGLGPSGVAALKAVQAAAVRLSCATVTERPVLDNQERLVGYLASAPARAGMEEEMRVLFLDGRDRLIADEAQAKGTANRRPLCPREVVRRALEVGAAALILVSGPASADGAPARAHVEMAAEIKAAAAVFGVVLRDHLTVGRVRHTPLGREGLL